MDRLAFQQFISRALSGQAGGAVLSLGRVSDGNAVAVRVATGIDIAGFVRTISASEVRHIFKSHGDPAREALRGQQAITKADLAEAVVIAERAVGVIVKGEERGHKPRRLVYTSPMNGGTVEYVETLHPGRRVVAVKTMRKC